MFASIPTIVKIYTFNTVQERENLTDWSSSLNNRGCSLTNYTASLTKDAVLLPEKAALASYRANSQTEEQPH